MILILKHNSKTAYQQKFVNLVGNNINFLAKNSPYCLGVLTICSYERSFRLESINNYIFAK